MQRNGKCFRGCFTQIINLFTVNRQHLMQLTQLHEQVQWRKSTIRACIQLMQAWICTVWISYGSSVTSPSCDAETTTIWTIFKFSDASCQPSLVTRFKLRIKPTARSFALKIRLQFLSCSMRYHCLHARWKSTLEADVCSVRTPELEDVWS